MNKHNFNIGETVFFILSHPSKIQTLRLKEGTIENYNNPTKPLSECDYIPVRWKDGSLAAPPFTSLYRTSEEATEVWKNRNIQLFNKIMSKYL